MGQPILVLGLQRSKWESLSRFFDRDGKPTEDFRAYQSETEKAFVESGGKRIILARDAWGFSGWDAFYVNEFPDMESYQKLYQQSQAQRYGTYFDRMMMPGVDVLKSFQDQEHIRKMHR